MSRELPQDYEPFGTLRVCSNVLVGGGHILTVADQPVLLVGRGVLPLVWCSVPADKDFTDWIYVVERNTSTREILKVESSREFGEVKVLMKNEIIIRVVKKSEDEAEIDQLNLTHIGFDVRGDRNGLTVGGSVLRYNRFLNVLSMIGIPPTRVQVGL